MQKKDDFYAKCMVPEQLPGEYVSKRSIDSELDARALPGEIQIK